MSPIRILAMLLMLSHVSCTAILVQTTGSQGIQEDPTERTVATVLEDEAIETKVVVNMRSQEPAFRRARLKAHSHNGVVLLVGQVPNEDLKAKATEIASQASNKIKRIHNELEVSSNTDIIRRGNDAFIATKIRTLMLTNRDVPKSQIKVITENRAVYLMGLISQAEGDNAANLARNVNGVKRVVKVFEYVN